MQFNRRQRIFLWVCGMLLLGISLALDLQRPTPKVYLPIILLMAIATFVTFRPRSDERDMDE